METMIETKVCSRCGQEKSIEEFYKVKYKNRETKYNYSVCKTCMSIEQRRRYLLQSDPGHPMLAKIDALYEKHRAAGRSVPTASRRSSSNLEQEIDAMLNEE